MSIQYDPSRPVYIHVINKLRQPASDLFEAMEGEVLDCYAEHGLHLHSCWESGPGQGSAPETIEVWEMKDFSVYTAFVSASHGPGADPRLRAWQRGRGEWIAESDSMLCFAHPASPTIAELKQNNIKSKLVCHEYVHTLPSKQAEYLDAIYRMWWKVAQKAGRSLLGLYFSPWNNCRAINIWGIGEEWDDIPLWGQAYDDSDEFTLWMNMGLALRDDWNDRFMVPAPFSVVR